MQALALHGHNKPVTDIKFNRDGDLLFSVAKEPGACVWRTSDGHLIGKYNTDKASAGCDVNRESTIFATASYDLKAELWNVKTGEKLAEIDQPAPCRAIAFNHDDRMLAVISDKKMGNPGTINFYNLPETLGVEKVKTVFNPTISIKETDEAITCMAWGPTNQFMYYGTDKGRVVQWDVESQCEITSQVTHDDFVNRLHFDADYLTLISSSKDKTAKLLDSRDCKAFRTYTSDNPVNDACISPICDHILLGGGTDAQDVTTSTGASKFDVKFYHKVNESYLGSLKCHFGTINTLQFSPSGRGFASGAVDGFVKIYNTFPQKYYTSPGSKPLWKHKSLSNDDDEENEEEEEDEEDYTVDGGADADLTDL
jgi:translation initiation factor 3 subunit I